MSFVSLSHASLAAKLRVSVLECPDWKSRCKLLDADMSTSIFTGRVCLWKSWYSSAFVFCIRSAVEQALRLH
eukprot:7594670-Karenia_brevis.AAC.1